MFTIKLSPQLEFRLNKLVQQNGRSRSYYVEKAIEEFLDEHEDYSIAVSRLEDGFPSIALSKAVKRIGLQR